MSEEENAVGRACLIVHGPDRPGLVAAISTAIARNHGNIVTLDQYSEDDEGGGFFQRVVFQVQGTSGRLREVEADLTRTLEPLGVNWRLTDQSIPKRMVILASTADHCLLELLWRHRRGELPVTIPMVISNHTNTEDDVRSFGVPFFHVPSQGPDKSAAESQIVELIRGNADFVVLARYMQILSEDFLDEVAVPIINIHHSFLPAFQGGKPYHQAYGRGVKRIGATAHYATPDLDEGPIIEQDVVRVSHRDTPDDLIRKGRDVERTVLSRAVAWHLEGRVLVNENKTVVFE